MISQFSAAETQTGSKTDVLKAVPVGQELTVGFAIVKTVEEPEGKGNPGEQREGTGMATQNGSPAASSAWHDSGEEMVEPEFCAVYMARLKEVYERHMAGRRHACKSSFLLSDIPRMRRKPCFLYSFSISYPPIPHFAARAPVLPLSHLYSDH